MALKRKYVIFKAEDWDRYCTYDHADGAEKEIFNELRERDIAPSSVVIRKQDVFAPNALYEYANQIRGACELFEKILGRANAPMPNFLKDELERLRNLADDFYDEAADSEERFTKKVPD